MNALPRLDRFNEYVLSKYQIYNSIFMTLPYNTVSKIGVILPLFHDVCKTGFENGKNPTEIVDLFFFEKNFFWANLITSNWNVGECNIFSFFFSCLRNVAQLQKWQRSFKKTIAFNSVVSPFQKMSWSLSYAHDKAISGQCLFLFFTGNKININLNA